MTCCCGAYNHAYELEGEVRLVHSESCDLYWE